MPPTTSATCRFEPPATLRNACSTCIANSRVGSRISAFEVLFCDFCNRSMIGIRKLSVLPVPVCAVASTSFPSSAGGIAFSCTGVGVTKFAAARRVFNAGDKLKSENWFMCPFSPARRTQMHRRTAGICGSSGYSFTVLMNQNVCVWENPSESNPMVEIEVPSRHEVLPDAASRMPRIANMHPLHHWSGYAVGAWENYVPGDLALEGENGSQPNH